MRPGGSSEDSDSDSDGSGFNFVNDRNALAETLRNGEYFDICLDVGSRCPTYGGWVRCYRPTREVNSRTHWPRMECTYGDRGHGSEPLMNPGTPPPLTLELPSAIPTRAWGFFWKKDYNIAGGSIHPRRHPHCPLCPRNTLTGWRPMMDHLKTTQIHRYTAAGGGREGTAVGDDVSDLHDDPVVLHRALYQAVQVERSVFWHKFNRYRIADVSVMALKRVGVRLNVDIPHNVLEDIAVLVEGLNGAAAVTYGANCFSAAWPRLPRTVCG